MPISSTNASPEAVKTASGARAKPLHPSARRSSHWPSLVALLAILCLGIGFRLVNEDTVIHRSPDERNYTTAANALLQQGSSALISLREQVRGQEMSPLNPLRFGYFYLLAATMSVTGARDAFVGVQLSCLSSIASLLLLAWFARRRFSPAAALASALLLAVSPLALMTARRAWEESLVELLALVLMFLAAEATAGLRSLPWMVIFALIGMLGVTIKQTVTLSFVLCSIWVLVVLVRKKEGRNALIFAGTCAVALLLGYAMLAHVLGGFHTVLELSSTASLQSNQYSIEFENGPPGDLFVGLWILGPATLLAACLAVVYAVMPRKPLDAARTITIALILFCAAFWLPAMFLPHHLNLRYIAASYNAYYLLAGVGIAFAVNLFHSLPKKQSLLPAGIIAVILVLVAMHDYGTFRNRFVRPDTPDLSIRMVLQNPSAYTANP